MLQTHASVAVQQLGAVRAEGAFRDVGLPAAVLLVISFMGLLFFHPIFFETFIWPNIRSSGADVPQPAFF